MGPSTGKVRQQLGPSSGISVLAALMPVKGAILGAALVTLSCAVPVRSVSAADGITLAQARSPSGFGASSDATIDGAGPGVRQSPSFGNSPGSASGNAEASGSASAECRLRMRLPSQVVWRGDLSRGYRVFSDNRHIEPFEIAVAHGGAACDFFVTLSADGVGAAELRGPRGGLAYEVLRGTSGSSALSKDIFGDARSQITGQFAAGGEEEQYILFLDIPSGQVARGGVYEGQVTVSLFSGSTATPTLVEQRLLGFSVNVPAVISAGFNDISDMKRKSTDFDFGTLKTGVSRSTSLHVLSNSDYAISLTSEAGGVMKHEQPEAAFGIPYEVTVDGRSLSLGAAPATISHGRATGATPAVKDITVRIGKVPVNAPAGHYHDTITLTVSSTE
jgi:spore coat protein U-like protein